MSSVVTERSQPFRQTGRNSFHGALREPGNSSRKMSAIRPRRSLAVELLGENFDTVPGIFKELLQRVGSGAIACMLHCSISCWSE